MGATMLLAREEGALALPPGVSPNFVDPENRNVEIHAVAGLTIGISTLFFVFRAYTRLFIVKTTGWDDYLLGLAWLLSIIYFIMAPLGIPYGAGVHQWNVPVSTYSEFAKRSNMTDIFYSPVMCMVKLAILIQLIHVFTPTRNRLYWGLVSLSVVSVMFYLACMLFRIFACVPRQKIWEPSLPGTCINSAAGIISSAALNVVFDFVLLAIPIFKISQLQMHLRKKVAIYAIFATGLFGCIASIMRLVASVHLLHTGDITWELMDVGFWCDAEINAGIVCCCLPVLPQLWRKKVLTLFSSLRSRLVSSTPGDTHRRSTYQGQASSEVRIIAPLEEQQKNSYYVELDDVSPHRKV